MTTTTMTARPASPSTSPVFDAPGPGHWAFDPAHWPRPVTPWLATVYPPGIRRGFAEGSARFGLLFSHVDLAVVNGYGFNRIVSAVPDGPGAEEFMAQRLEAGRVALETKVWRDELELWDREFKPDSIRRQRALQSVDLAALTDEGLAGHLAECRDNHAEMVYRHHRFSIPALVPLGLFLARAAEWTGSTTSELLGLLRGSSPISTGIAAAELREVGAALRDAGLGPESFAGQSAAAILQQLRAMPGAVGDAVQRYLDACGLHSASGYDVAELTTGELPDTVVGAFWTAREGGGPAGDDPTAERERAIRALVPAEHRAEFDALLAEARLVNRMRDERGIHNDLWASGIARRAILEAGRRLALRGRVDDAELIFTATPDEMIDLLRGAARPSSAELQARADARDALPPSAVPAWIGDEPAPPPSLDGLPPHAQLLAMATGIAIGEVLGVPPPESLPATLTGKGVSAGIYEGTARVVNGPADFNRLKPGDVLVTTSTNAAFNVVLPLLGAIVTDRGALLSHAAIVARECGIPAVVATIEATKRVADGARVRVDGARGVVEVL